VIDDDTSFVGSFNLDPRSADINSEIGLLVHSEAFARQVRAFLDEGARPENGEDARCCSAVGVKELHEVAGAALGDGEGGVGAGVEVGVVGVDGDTVVLKKFSARAVILILTAPA